MSGVSGTHSPSMTIPHSGGPGSVDPHNWLITGWFNCLDMLLQHAGGPLFGAVPTDVTQSEEVQK